MELERTDELEDVFSLSTIFPALLAFATVCDDDPVNLPMLTSR
jgi:hypothetical protein